MHACRSIRLVALFATTAIGLGGCTGEIISPPRPTASTCTAASAADMSAAGFLQCTCPSVPATLGTCGETRIERSALSCGGPEAALFFKIENSRPAEPALGTNRYTVAFREGSRFQGSMIVLDPTCSIQDGTDIDFTFGAVYTGDQGEEMDPDGKRRDCIRQSRMVFSSFNFDLVGNFIHEGAMKKKLHETVDGEIIKQLGATTVSNAGRCLNWREMPATP